MKIIVIGDIHGRNIWKEIVDKEGTDADKIIFIGDYLDTHEVINGRQQLLNLRDIIGLKRNNPKQIELLLGNHDYHYIPGIGEHYSGYDPVFSIDFGEIIQDSINKDLIKICYAQSNILFTHAGISQYWLNHVAKYEGTFSTLDIWLNEQLKYKPQLFCFQGGDSTGNTINSSPIWIRPPALMSSKSVLPGMIQVVGHTQQTQILGINPQYWFIDCLGYTPQYLSIQINVDNQFNIDFEVKEIDKN